MGLEGMMIRTSLPLGKHGQDRLYCPQRHVIKRLQRFRKCLFKVVEKEKGRDLTPSNYKSSYAIRL